MMRLLPRRLVAPLGTSNPNRLRLLVRLPLLLIVGAAGCGADDGPPRVAVRGEVMVDGVPLPSGYIVFSPINGAGGKAGGAIENGHYEIDEADGPTIGELRVEIVADEQMAFALDDPEAFSTHLPHGHLPRNRIPPQYNQKSKLVERTTPDGPNEFKFQLSTKSTR